MKIERDNLPPRLTVKFRGEEFTLFLQADEEETNFLYRCSKREREIAFHNGDAIPVVRINKGK